MLPFEPELGAAVELGLAGVEVPGFDTAAVFSWIAGFTETNRTGSVPAEVLVFEKADEFKLMFEPVLRQSFEPELGAAVELGLAEMKVRYFAPDSVFSSLLAGFVETDHSELGPAEVEE